MGGGEEEGVWKEDGVGGVSRGNFLRQNENNPTSNPEPQSVSRQTPAVQQLGVDSALPLVHRS